MGHRPYFRHLNKQLSRESAKKLEALRKDESLIDDMEPAKLRSWLRFLINENFRLESDKSRLMDLIPEQE